MPSGVLSLHNGHVNFVCQQAIWCQAQQHKEDDATSPLIADQHFKVIISEQNNYEPNHSSKLAILSADFIVLSPIRRCHSFSSRLSSDRSWRPKLQCSSFDYIRRILLFAIEGHWPRQSGSSMAGIYRPLRPVACGGAQNNKRIKWNKTYNS